jgi:hypothetical protein
MVGERENTKYEIRNTKWVAYVRCVMYDVILFALLVREGAQPVAPRREIYTPACRQRQGFHGFILGCCRWQLLIVFNYS